LQSTLGTKEGHSAIEGGRSATHADVLVRRGVGSQRRLLVISLLVFSDILVALMMWQVASVIQGAVGRWQLSGIAAASIVPSIVVWVGLRAVLGLYPGYGAGKDEPCQTAARSGRWDTQIRSGL
jgi:hypothetical protein